MTSRSGIYFGLWRRSLVQGLWVVVAALLSLVASGLSVCLGTSQAAADTAWAGSGFCTQSSWQVNGTSAYAGTTYRGVAVCKGSYYGQIYRTVGSTRVYTEADGGCCETSWQCTEFANRYFYAETGYLPVTGDGKDIVANIASKHYSGLTASAVTDAYSSSIQPGAIISMWGASGPGHVAVVQSVSVSNGTGSIELVGENQGQGPVMQVAVVGGRLEYQDNVVGSFTHYQWLTGTNLTSMASPTGHVDSVTSDAVGTVHVRGWAFDADKKTTAIGVHIYIGGPAGSGEGHAILANTSRPDVGAAYPGVGNGHGFDATLSTDMRGLQTVYAYAINASGTPGGNTLIGEKQVRIMPREEEMIRVPGDNAVWWIHGGNRYWVPDWTVGDCLGGPSVVHSVDTVTRDHYPDSHVKASCDDHMIQVPGAPEVWLIHGTHRSHVPSESVVDCLGGRGVVHMVTAAVRDSFPDDGVQASCDGKLIQVPGDPAVWWISHGQRSHVPSPDVLACLGGWRPVHYVVAATRDRFPDSGSPKYCSMTHLTPATVRGDRRVGSTLRATAGTWSPTPAATGYRWIVGGRTVKSGASPTLKLASHWRGLAVRVVMVIQAPTNYQSVRLVKRLAGRIR